MTAAAARARSQQSTPSDQSPSSNPSVHVSAIKYAHQAAKLSHLPQDAEGTNDGSAAVEAEWITPQDPVIITADGGRLPGVPLAEAHKLDQLKDEVDVGMGKRVVEGEVSNEKGEGEKRPASPANGLPSQSDESFVPAAAAVWTSVTVTECPMRRLQMHICGSFSSLSRRHRLGLGVY
ncbi:hypothetical protein VE04_06228 [Pseudogymnoascus sp. 24MN13]|nr:hypothetical protein VE04_06228 [Pseudogymnoascus sp. 24MN13]